MVQWASGLASPLAVAGIKAVQLILLHQRRVYGSPLVQQIVKISACAGFFGAGFKYPPIFNYVHESVKLSFALLIAFTIFVIVRNRLKVLHARRQERTSANAANEHMHMCMHACLLANTYGRV